MAYNTQIRWKAIEHRQSKLKGEHVILVAYKRRGTAFLNEVVGVTPLFDLRDMNFDGSVSIPERAYSAAWWDPYEVFSLMKPAGNASCLIEAGDQLRDYSFSSKAKEGFLVATHKAASRALTSLMVERCLGPGIEANLAISAITRLKKYSTEAQFVVQTILETVIMESICATHK